jgi:hypothetical protein
LVQLLEFRVGKDFMTQRIQNCGVCSATCIFEPFKWYMKKCLLYRWHTKAGLPLAHVRENIKKRGTKTEKKCGENDNLS